MNRPSGEQSNEPFSKFPIDEHRRLWTPDFEPYTGWEEYYDSNLSSRVLVLPANHPDAVMHSHLSEMRLPTLSTLYHQEKMLLLVPEGSRQLSRILRFIARDIDSYGEIFKQAGGILENLKVNNVGLPAYSDKHQVLDSLIFSPDEDSFYGGKLYLVPPYRFNPKLTKEDIAKEINFELQTSGHFTNSEDRRALIKNVEDGWDHK